MHQREGHRCARRERAFVASADDTVECVGRACRLSQRGRRVAPGQVGQRARVHGQRVAHRIGREVFADDGKRFGSIRVGEFELTEFDPVVDEVLDEDAGLQVPRPEQRARVGHRRLEHRDAAHQVAGVAESPGIDAPRFDHARVRRRLAVRRKRLPVRLLAAREREIELAGVAVGQRQQHRAGHPLRVAFAEPRFGQRGAFARELLGLGVSAEVDRCQRAVRECGGEIAGTGAGVSGTRAQGRQDTVEIGARLLRAPAETVHLRLQNQGTHGLLVRRHQGALRFGHGARDHRLGRRHVTEREQALADHVREFDACAALASERGF